MQAGLPRLPEGVTAVGADEPAGHCADPVGRVSGVTGRDSGDAAHRGVVAMLQSVAHAAFSSGSGQVMRLDFSTTAFAPKDSMRSTRRFAVA